MSRYSPIFLILIAIGLFFFFIDPQYKEVRALQDERTTNSELLVLAKELQERRDKLRASFNAISEQEKEGLNKMLPDTVDNVRLILDISNIADKYGIIIRNISIKESEPQTNSRQVASADTSGGVGTIGVGFTVAVEYDVFIQFLQDLEESLRVVDIKSLSVDLNNDGQGLLNYAITLDTYWLR